MTLQRLNVLIYRSIWIVSYTMYDIESRGLESDVRLLLTDLIMINTACVLQELLTLREYIGSPSGISGCPCYLFSSPYWVIWVFLCVFVLVKVPTAQTTELLWVVHKESLLDGVCKVIVRRPYWVMCVVESAANPTR